MGNKTIFFDYVSFLRKKVDGPTEAYPNMSFSIILDTDDPEDIVADIETAVRQLPFLSCTLVVEDVSTREYSVHNWEMLKPTHTL